MRLGKTLSALLLIALWLSHGFLACRAVQSFPGDSSGLTANYRPAFYGQAKHDSILMATQVRPIWARFGADQADQSFFLAFTESGHVAQTIDLSAVATTLAPPDLAVTWQFACRTALFPRSPS
jgi:hypothetical protein